MSIQYTKYDPKDRHSWPSIGEPANVVIIYRGLGQTGFSKPVAMTFHPATMARPDNWQFAADTWAIDGNRNRDRLFDIRFFQIPPTPIEKEPHQH